MSTQSSDTTGVILMTYGSATSAEHVEEYFNSIYKGTAPAALIQDFEKRYRMIGRSPLIEITERQAVCLGEVLGNGCIVRAGMRHSAPFIEAAVAECRNAGATSLIGIILSPQFSSVIMNGYTSTFMDAAERHGLKESARVAGPWGTEPHFIELLAERIQESLDRLTKKYQTTVPVIFTTHSLPMRVIEKDPGYLQQLQKTIDAVREKLDPKLEWYAAYQSAGHTPEEWLTPDVVDVLAGLHAKKAPAVLIVPIQFLADHLEILYDLDIAARKQCADYHIDYHRIELPNTDARFIRSLESVTRSTVIPL